MGTPYLTNAEYEAVVHAGLSQQGIGSEVADALLRARYPMDAMGLLAELSGRGRLLTLDDLAEFLRDRFGEPIDPMELAYNPSQADAVLAWAAEHDRGRPTLSALVLEKAPKLIEKTQRAGAFKCN